MYDNGSLRELAKATNPILRERYGMITPRLREAIEAEIKRGTEKWGATATCPGVLLNAALEELGETAHAINHSEESEKVKQEIIETVGILVRLYWMLGED